MILPDVNVLVYSFVTSESRHATYHAWLTATVNGSEPLALSDTTVSGFVRIVTNRRIYERPATTAAAAAFVDELAGAPSARWIGATAATWREFRSIVAGDAQVRANLVPDAWLASLAISHRARLATADRGMARYPHLDWFDPADTG
jgi:uncharacterized protein